MDWRSWDDPAGAEVRGADGRRQAALIRAPEGTFRVCAFHIDFDERPTCYRDVASPDEARAICADLAGHCSWNVDYAAAFDSEGAVVAGGRPY